MRVCKFLDGSWRYVVVLILLVAFVLQGYFSLLGDSAIEDEPPHIGAGYSYLAKGDLRMNPEHPPLIKELAAVPMLFLGLKVDWQSKNWLEGKEWEFGDDLLYSWGNDADAIIRAGRLVVLGLGVLLGVFIWLFAQKLYGKRAGILALTLFAFCPNLIAHSRFVTTDLGVTLFGFGTVYFFYRYLKEGRRKLWLVLTAVFFGCTLGSKFSGLLFFAVLPMLAFWHMRQTKGKVSSYLKPLLFIFVFGVVLLWSFYGFSISAYPQLVEWSFTTVAKNVPGFVGHMVPTAFWVGLLNVLTGTVGGRESYLFGEFQRGYVEYFPIAFLIKTPIPTLILLALTTVSYLVKKVKLRLEEVVLLVPVLVLGGMALFSQMNIGLRHILPIYPFLFVFVARLANLSFYKPNLVQKVLFAAVLVWYVVGTARVYPAYLSYFNEFVGGPQNGYLALIDSNCDWGQELKRLKVYLDQNDIDSVYLDYFGGGNADYYGIKYKKMNASMRDARGYIVVSSSSLQWPYSQDGKTYYYDWLKQYEPIKKIGNALFVYNIK